MSFVLKDFLKLFVSEPYVGGFPEASSPKAPAAGNSVNVTVTNVATFAEKVMESGTSTNVGHSVTVTQTVQGGAPAAQRDSPGTDLEAVSQVCRNLGGPPKGGQVATTLAPAANNPGTKKKQR